MRVEKEMEKENKNRSTNDCPMIEQAWNKTEQDHVKMITKNTQRDKR